MTVSVRPWAEISADLREFADYMPRGPLLEAAVAGDALAAEVARLTAEVERLNKRRLRDPNERIS